MTDDEIIEGLECCFKNRKPCKKCPFYNMEQCNELLVGEFVYNLINRQRAEIENLRAIIDAELDTIHDLGDDYERLIEDEGMHIKKAIKEFAERLCEGRVSNDPVVITVRAELRMGVE